MNLSPRPSLTRAPPALHSDLLAWARDTYSASWSWGSARPRCRRSRGCDCRRCQSSRFLLGTQVRGEVGAAQWGWAGGWAGLAWGALGHRGSQGRTWNSLGPQSAPLWAVPFLLGAGGPAQTSLALTGTAGGGCHCDVPFPGEGLRPGVCRCPDGRKVQCSSEAVTPGSMFQPLLPLLDHPQRAPRAGG